MLSVLQDKRINKTLVGLEKIDQLKEIIKVSKKKLKEIDTTKFITNDIELVDPRFWNF